MGTDRYERATVAPTLIKTLIKALFDEEYGRENGLYRASTDYFAHRQLEHVVDQLWEAGPPNENIGDAPRSSDEEVTRTIRRQLQLDPNTFANVMGGVGNRLAYISQDTHLRQIFNNTENQFDFRDVLDEDTVILFDLGDLRDDAARIMTGVILTNLDAALKDRKRTLSQHPDDYVVNLLVDEAASVVVSDIMNDLLERAGIPALCRPVDAVPRTDGGRRRTENLPERPEQHRQFAHRENQRRPGTGASDGPRRDGPHGFRQSDSFVATRGVDRQPAEPDVR